MSGRDDALGAGEWQLEGQDAGLGDDELTAVEQNDSLTARERAADDGAESGLTPAELDGSAQGEQLGN